MRYGLNISTAVMVALAVGTLLAARTTWPYALRERVGIAEWLARMWLLVWAAFGIGGAAAQLDLKLWAYEMRGTILDGRPNLKLQAPPAPGRDV